LNLFIAGALGSDGDFLFFRQFPGRTIDFECNYEQGQGKTLYLEQPASQSGASFRIGRTSSEATEIEKE
jgi:hypothetical protein